MHIINNYLMKKMLRKVLLKKNCKKNSVFFGLWKCVEVKHKPSATFYSEKLLWFTLKEFIEKKRKCL